jgi:uncharacterized membrane protein YdbT with pleckstrin-like domain
MSEEQVLYEAHPAMFRNHPIWFVVTVLLCLVGVGFLILVPWWFQSRGITLTVTTERTRLRRGILSKHTNVVFHNNVRNIQVGQTFLQRLLGVGYVGVASAGHAGMEIEVHGVPDPEKVKQLIDQHRRG